MEISLTEKFLKESEKLTKDEQFKLFEVILKLPKAIKNLHEHEGIGLRKIHTTGIFEARLGLGLRLIFGYRGNSLVLHRIGNHDEIKKYLKNL